MMTVEKTGASIQEINRFAPLQLRIVILNPVDQIRKAALLPTFFRLDASKNKNDQGDESEALAESTPTSMPVMLKATTFQ